MTSTERGKVFSEEFVAEEIEVLDGLIRSLVLLRAAILEWSGGSPRELANSA